MEDFLPRYSQSEPYQIFPSIPKMEYLSRYYTILFYCFYFFSMKHEYVWLVQTAP